MTRWARRLTLIGIVLILLSLLAIPLGRRYWGQQQLDQGLRQLERYQPTKAIPHFANCLRVWPNRAGLHLLLAQAHRQAGDFDAAEHHLAEHRRLAPDEDAPRALELALMRAQNGDLESVEGQLLDRVYNQDPKSPLILEALIQGNLRMYRVTSALSSLGLWLTHEPDNPRALFLRGRAWESVAAYSRAVADYSRVLELDDEQDEARLRLTDCLIQQTKFTEALPHLEQLRQTRPDDAALVVQLAHVKNVLGQREEAETLLAELLERQPEHAPALRGRGQIAFQAQQFAEAEGWLQQALQADPWDRQSNYLYLQCLQSQGKTQQAAQQSERLKQVERDITRLIEISTKEMSDRPRDASLHYEVGAIQRRMGQIELSRRWFHSALLLDPKHRAAHQALAEHYQQSGETRLADYHRRQAEQVVTTP